MLLVSSATQKLVHVFAGHSCLESARIPLSFAVREEQSGLSGVALQVTQDETIERPVQCCRITCFVAGISQSLS
jgi:hypothetical protein